MEFSAFIDELGGILGFAVTVLSIWRFGIKPKLDAQAAEQERSRRRQVAVDARLTLLESHAPDEVKVQLRQLREDLLRDLNDG